MTTKLRPSYADSVTATSWSPWPKAWVGNHYGPASRVYYPETHSRNLHAGRGKNVTVASPADYIPYFSLALDHLVLTSIDD